jgi:protein SCO1
VLPRAGARKLLGIVTIIAGACLISAATWTAFRYGIVRSESGLPVLGRVPDFALTGSHGEPVSQADLAGGIWIADFIFTTCPGECPVLSAQMAKLQQSLARETGKPVRLVSFSVDPSHDTPDALRTYAERFRADPSRWLFLTGDRDALQTLIREGFRLAVAERSPADDTDGQGLITHSDRFVLVDSALNIRGYYHGTDEESVQQLVRDVTTLHNQS